MSQNQQEENSSLFILHSKIDNQKLNVDKKIIDSSSLLKNICDITEITEPILINCPSDSLKVFIALINHYQTIQYGNHDTEFEKNLYDSATLNYVNSKNRKVKQNAKKNLIKLIQDLCILDSDFFLDSIADYILGIIGNEESIGGCWNYIRQYLGFEDDFTKESRNLMENDEKLEYFLSINTENFKFPFPNKNLYSLKTDFSTPMNALIAVIIKRSNEKTSYLLSLINKTLKNEVDRHPLKFTGFSAGLQHWKLNLFFNKLKKGFTLYLNCTKFGRSYFESKDINYDENYINILKNRKIMAQKVHMFYGNILEADKPIIDCSSLNFIISKSAEVMFQKSYKTMYLFDVTKCSIPSIFYRINSVDERGIKFEEFFKHLIAKDLSKTIRMDMAGGILKFFDPYSVGLRFCKKPNASKFELLFHFSHYQNICSEFKVFFENYMDDSGYFVSQLIPEIPLDETCVIEPYKQYEYKVSDVKKYMNCIITK